MMPAPIQHSAPNPRATAHSILHILATSTLSLLLPLNGCGGAVIATATTTTTTTNATNPYDTAYKAATWGSTATVTFPASCTLTFATTGLPNYTPSPYYLQPLTTAYPTAVAETPVSHLQLSLVPFLPASIRSASVTINDCPTKAATTTATNLGVIGYTLAGVALFNPYEGGANPPPALSDNVSYTFKDATGATLTASFIDACNQHPTPVAAGYTLHYHGIPTCVVSQVDTASGPSHLIGFALDGFPIYGGRDINGAIIDASKLDACNGITSPTPEFPAGAYHYVLPIGVTGSQSSINCYAGTITQTQMAEAKKKQCLMPALSARAAI